MKIEIELNEKQVEVLKTIIDRHNELESIEANDIECWLEDVIDNAIENSPGYY